MKITKNILNEYVDIEDLDIKKVEEKLTMSGTKVETIESLKGKMKDIVVGKILEIEKHPDADKLVVTKTDVKDEILQIVTGASNLIVGDIIPVVKPNGVLPNGTVIKPGKLRGIVSNGMLCSAGELNISYLDSIRPDKNGIFVMDKSYEKNLGEDVSKVLNLDEYILDFEITPNRPDCLGTLGIGREMAASVKREFKGYDIIESEEKLLEELKNIDGNFNITKSNEEFNINIEDKDAKKFALIEINNIENIKTPKEIANKLKYLGIESNGIIVDLTNYLMLELGQPLHAYDKSILGKNILLRKAKSGEKVVLLDKKEYELENELVVTSDDEVCAVAGVMGTEKYSINENTKDIVIEIAAFDGPRVRRASKSLKMRTESSGRFEKGLPISYVYTGVKRVVDIFSDLKLGKINTNILLIGDGKDEERSILFDQEKINRHLGTNIPEDEMLDILKSLKFKVQENENGEILIKVPSFRKDVKLIEDLAEEVIRIHGYFDLPSTLPNFIGSLSENKSLDIQTKGRHFLKNNGFLEMCTYSFTNEKDLAKLNLGEDDLRIKNAVKLINKLNEDQSIMRSETLPEFLNRIKYNLDMKNEDLKLFEIGRIYVKQDEEKLDKDNLPLEEKVLSLAINKKDFYILKGVIFKLLNTYINRMPEIFKSEDKIFHPGISADLKYGKEIISSFGEVHPVILQNFGIKEKIYFGKIYLDRLEKYVNNKRKFKEISKFPSSERDIAIVIDKNTRYKEVERCIENTSKNLIEEIKLFDIFENAEKLGKDKKSFGINIRFRAKDRTLDDEEVNKEMEKILENLNKEFNAELRK